MIDEPWQANTVDLRAQVRLEPGLRLHELFRDMFGLEEGGMGDLTTRMERVANAYPEEIEWQPRARRGVAIGTAVALVMGLSARAGARRALGRS